MDVPLGEVRAHDRAAKRSQIHAELGEARGQRRLQRMMVSELITNASRHGLRQRGGSILVELSTPDGSVQCLVTDDGRSINPKPGRFTRITSAPARELGGRIDWHFAPSGTTALLQFPSDRATSKRPA